MKRFFGFLLFIIATHSYCNSGTTADSGYVNNQRVASVNKPATRCLNHVGHIVANFLRQL